MTTADERLYQIEVSQRQVDAFLAAVRTAQRAVVVARQEGLGVTDQGCWDEDGGENAAIDQIVRQRFDKIFSDLGTLALAARAAGAQR
jgi:hypothetical protein